MDFSRLMGYQRFDELCKVLLKLEEPNFENTIYYVDGRGGDKGVDCFEGTFSNKKCIFQIKFFPNKIYSSHMTKIEKSFETASKNYPKTEKWILIIPADLTPGQFKDLNDLEIVYNIKIDLWDLAKLEELVLKHYNLIIKEFIELFPTQEIVHIVGQDLLDKANESAKNVIDTMIHIQTESELSKTDLEMFTPFSEFNLSNKDCWLRGYFRIEDVYNDYDYRRSEIDEILSSLSEKKGMIIYGIPYSGKSTLLKRIIIEEIKKGYVVLFGNRISVKYLKWCNFIEKLISKYEKILIILDNIHDNLDGVEIFKVLNKFNSEKIKFIFATRKYDFELLQKKLERDKFVEIQVAMENVFEFNLDFDLETAEGIVNKALSTFNKDLSNYKYITKFLYDNSKRDPLIFTYGLINLLNSSKIENNDLNNPEKYLEIDFEQQIKKLDGKPSLWKTAVFCLFLGMIGIRIDVNLLKNCKITSDCLVELVNKGFLISEFKGYVVRHEYWSMRFFHYIIRTKFNDDIDSFFKKNNFDILLQSLSNTFDINDSLIFFL